MRTVGSDIPSYNVGKLPVRFSLMVKNDIMSFPEINHWHDDMEFIVVTKGPVRINVNGKEYSIYEGQMLFINSRQMHYAIWDENDTVYRQLTIHPDILFDNEYLRDYYDKLCGEGVAPLMVFSKGSQRQKNIIDAVNTCFEHIYKGHDDFTLLGEIMALVSKMLDYVDNRPKTKRVGSKNINAMHAMIGFVQEKYREKMSITDIAKSGGIGRSKCCELFRQMWDLSPNDYLNLYRLEKSIVLFKDESLSITDIAAKSGFNGSSYYAEIFKKVTGLSPTEYRKNISLRTFSSKK